jgi:cobyrinic acid a,c-diamide synthase
VAAEVKGFWDYQSESQIAGVIYNRISPMLYPAMAQAVGEATGLPSFGYLPKLPDCTIESRHLGLKTAEEIYDLKEKLQRLAAEAEKTLALDDLLTLAQSAPKLTDKLPKITPVTATAPVIAVAMDTAFCFYYQESLHLLEQLGARLVSFSPLEDSHLPEGCAGLYLGGGYPELYGTELAQNVQLRGEIRKKIQDGLPTIAECGGFLYLQEELEDANGIRYPMVGALKGTGFPTKKLQRFGYADLRAKADNLILKAGESIPAHEFHYWNTTDPGSDFYTQKPQSNRGWDNAFSTPTLYAGFPHFHFWSNPNCARRFVKACARYQEEQL